MVACALTGEELEEEAELEETDEDEEEVSVCVFGLKTRSDRTEKRFLIFVSGMNVGCWFILAGDVLAFFFFLSPGGEKESTDAFLLGREGKSMREAVTSELFANFIEAALIVLFSNISSPFLQIDE